MRGRTRVAFSLTFRLDCYPLSRFSVPSSPNTHSQESLDASSVGLKEFQQSWLLEEGDVFNCDLLDRSILRLRRRFRVVQYDLDKHPETGKVDVMLNLQGPWNKAG